MCLHSWKNMGPGQLRFLQHSAATQAGSGGPWRFMLCAQCLCELLAGWHSAPAPPSAASPLGSGVLAWQELPGSLGTLTLCSSMEQAPVSLPWLSSCGPTGTFLQAVKIQNDS